VVQLNIALSILHLYPDAVPSKDFIVQDDSDYKGPYLAAWNLDEPQPTDEELKTAWEAYQEAEANKPPQLTEIEKLQAENAGLALELAQTKMQLNQIAQEQANVLLSLVEGGVL
jgi:hypothetical protein